MEGKEHRGRRYSEGFSDLEEEIRIVKEDKFRKIRHLLADQKVLEDVKDSRQRKL